MTNEEALYCLNNFKKGCTIYPCPFPRDTPCKLPEAKRIAEKALEKQIPKKPEQRNEMDFCPNCEHWFDETYDVLFCPDCGQKIDWSDEYDE